MKQFALQDGLALVAGFLENAPENLDDDWPKPDRVLEVLRDKCVKFTRAIPHHHRRATDDAITASKRLAASAGASLIGMPTGLRLLPLRK